MLLTVESRNLLTTLFKWKFPKNSSALNPDNFTINTVDQSNLRVFHILTFEPYDLTSRWLQVQEGLIYGNYYNGWRDFLVPRSPHCRGKVTWGFYASSNMIAASSPKLSVFQCASFTFHFWLERFPKICLFVLLFFVVFFFSFTGFFTDPNFVRLHPK